MSRNGLYLIIAVLLVAAAGLGVYAYQQQQAKPGLEVKVDNNGVSINGNG